jgi:tight adherence protein C
VTWGGLSIVFYVLRYGAIAAASLTVVFLTYAIASAPTRVASRLGLRGLKRQRAIAKNEAWAHVEPLVRWLGVRVSGLPTDQQRAAIDRQIALAGDYMGLTADEFIALSMLSSVAGLMAGLLLGYLLDMGAMMAGALTLFGAALPYLQVTGMATERLKSIGRGLPYTIDLMALSMGAGLDFPGAVRQVVEKSSNPDDPIIEELTFILQQLNLGQTRRQALLDFAARAPVESVTEFANALIQAEERGNPVAEVLSIQATVSRTRRSVRAEESAAKAGVALTGPLVLVFFSVLILMLGPAMMKLQGGFN